MAISIAFPPPACVFLPFTAPGAHPDKEIFLFTRLIAEGKPIKLFNHGKMRRDFTHIDDVSRVVSKLVERAPQGDAASAGAPARIYNVGNHSPEELTHVVALLEKELGRTAQK